MNSIIPQGFASRHIGPNDGEIVEMLKAVGCDTLDQLIAEVVPEQIQIRKNLGLPEAMTEYEYLHHIRALAAKNQVFRTYIGMGYYNTITPPAILRNLFENPGW